MKYPATQRVLTIDYTERLGVTANGNPRYCVHFTNGENALTQNDAAVNYALNNAENLGVPLNVAFTRAGRVVYIALLK